jgi:hypothetical protein
MITATLPTTSTNTRETPITTAWPTIGATACGCWVGRLSAMKLGVGGFFNVGKLMALATIPVSLTVFCWQLMPYVCRRYLLTNRRVIVQKGLSAVAGQSLGLDEFDAIDVAVLPGQAWLNTGDVVFLRDGKEVLRLPGVSRPEIFRQVCLKARTALVGFRDLAMM